KIALLWHGSVWQHFVTKNQISKMKPGCLPHHKNCSEVNKRTWIMKCINATPAFSLWTLLILCAASACRKGPVFLPPPLSKKPPVAFARFDRQLTLPRDTTILDGKYSFDPDGRIVSYSWSKLSGPANFEISTQNTQKTA